MGFRRFLKACVVLIMTALPLVAVERGDGVLYVDCNNDSSHQDGSSWKHAYSDLQHALTKAECDYDISQIKIACGVYKPSKTYSPKDAQGNPVVAGAMSLPQYNPGIDNDGNLLNYADNPSFYNHKLRTFQLVDGVDLIGGYCVKHDKGCKAKNSCCRTVLDGNLGTEENPDRVWHVLLAGNDLTIQGVSCNLVNLTLQNGDASAAPYFPINYFLDPGQVPVYYHDDGAGLFVTCKSFINLYDVTVQHSNAIAGSGVYADDGSIIKFTRCTFNDNTGFDGAAIMIRSGGAHDNVDFNHRTSTSVIKDCVFTNNNGFNFGTIGAYDNYSDPDLGPNLKIVGCTFRDTTPFGIISTFSCNLQVLDCEIDNLGIEGGLGIYVGTPTFTKVCKTTIKNNNNTNAFPGGAISIRTPRILNNLVEISGCIFTNNTTVDAEGGAISLRSVDFPIQATVKCNVFKNNESTVAGGAIYLSNAVVSNNICKDNTFEGNAAPVGPNIFAESDVYLPSPCRAN